MCCPNIFHVSQTSELTLSKSIKEKEGTNYALAADNSFWQWGVRKASSDCGIYFFTAALSATMVNSGKASSADLKWIILNSTTGHMTQAVPFFWKQPLQPSCRYRQASFCWFFSGSVCKVSISKEDLKKHQLNFHEIKADQVKTTHIRLLARQFY